MKKRKLKKEVKRALKAVGEIAMTMGLAIVLTFGVMIAMTEAHYQRLDYYQELASK